MRSLRPRLALLPVLALLLGGARAVAGEAPLGPDFLDPRVLDLEPYDAVKGYPARVVLSGRLLNDYRSPVVTVIRPDGRAVRVKDVEVRDQAFRAELALQHGNGVYRVEVTGTDGQQVTHTGARIRLFAGASPDAPDEPLPAGPPEAADVAPHLLEARLFALVNAHRKAARLEPFAWLEPLAVAARDHLEAAFKQGHVDHRLGPERSHVADRLYRLFRWYELSYSMPPGPPSARGGDYVCDATDTTPSLALLLYRWKRFAAFCYPMTSEDFTHAACAVRRHKSGLFVVFVYAQLNGSAVRDDVAARQAAALAAVRNARADAQKAGALRELGRWRGKAARDEAKRELEAADPELRAAAWDVLVLLDEDAATERLSGLWTGVKGGLAPGRKTAEALAAADWVLRMAYWPEGAKDARAVRAEVEAWGAKALADAIGRADPADAGATRKALEALRREYPGTPAAAAAKERLDAL
jgi:hypothetical protein